MSDFFMHPTAIVVTNKIESDSRIWVFTHVLPNAQTGIYCNCDHIFIENDVVIGDLITIKCGVQKWDGLRIEDNPFIGPNATFTNDLFPRSKRYPEQFTKTVIKKSASIDANATILASNTIGQNSMVGADAMVTKDVPPNAIVVDNPARITSYVSTAQTTQGAAQCVSVQGTGRVVEPKIPGVPDMRSSLSFAEMGQCLSFCPRWYFLVFDVPSRQIRGEHAH